MIDLAQEAPDTVFLAEDEAWMYLQATVMAVWNPVGETPVVRVDPGRSKVAFYGSLNLQTGEELATRTTELNASVTAQHLQQVLTSYPGQRIVLFWDRAPWHRGLAIREVLAANPRLEIVEFPTGSPDLNPQEQVWKRTRRAVSHNHVTPKLLDLADRFEAHLTAQTFRSAFLEQYGFYLVCPFLN